MPHALKLIVAAALLTLAAVAQTQMVPIITVKSAEAIVLQAESVIIAKVVEVPNAAGNSRYDPRVIVQVQERLKGPKGGARETLISENHPPLPEEQHRFKQDRLLISTDKEKAIMSIINLSDPEVRVPMADRKLVKGPNAILRRFRELAKGPISARDAKLAQLPLARDSDIRRTLGADLLLVPVNDQLEKQLLAGLGSGDPWQRINSIHMLHDFKSDKVADALRKLLADPYKRRFLDPEQGKGYVVSRYPVREAAHQMLQSWGENIPAPDLVREWDGAHLTSLQVAHEPIADEDLIRLQRAPALRELQLAYVPLTPSNFDHIAKLQSLTRLSVSYSKFDEANLSRLANMSRLEVFEAAQTAFTDAGLLTLAKLPSLRSVNVVSTRVTRQGAGAFRTLRPDVSLTLISTDRRPRPFTDNPLHHAAFNNNVEAARQVLKRDPSLLNSVDSDDRTAVHYAAAADSADVLELLLDKGANPNVQSKVGVTPLQWGMEFDSYRSVQMLIKHGVNLELARRDSGMIRLPNGTEVRGSHTALTASLLDGADDLALALVRAGANVNSRSEAQITPLMVAAQFGRPVETLKLLIDHGADVNAQNVWGDTPLHLAARNGDKAAVRFLLSNGADPFAKNAAGQRPLDLLPPG
ncbi:MAG: ankyrin repeat domain-containing protein [Fimbriimonas sp.]